MRLSSPVVRVALVTSNYPPSIGGIEQHVSELAVALTRLGCEIDVFAPRVREATSLPSCDAERPTEHRYWSLLQGTGYGLPVGLRTDLRRAARQYDVIHAHNYHGLAAAVAAFTDHPVRCFTPHYHGVGHTAVARLAHRPYRRIGSRIFARSDSVICVSEAERKLVARDFPATVGKLRVIPNGVNRRDLLAAEAFSLTSGRRTIVVAGRLTGYKRVDRVIAAMGHLTEDAELVVVGAGPRRVELENLAREVAPGRVRFAGPVTQHDVYRWFRTASVVATLSEHEAFGLVAAEAVVAGARVLASEIPAHAELASRTESGQITLIDDLSATSVAATLDRMLARGAHGAGDSGILDWDQVAGSTRDLYEEIIDAQ